MTQGTFSHPKSSSTIKVFLKGIGSTVFLFFLLSCAVFENKDKIVIIMEYASKGELYDYISERRRLSERETRHFFRQIVSAVHYCHKVSKGFDIKKCYLKAE